MKVSLENILFNAKFIKEGRAFYLSGNEEGLIGYLERRIVFDLKKIDYDDCKYLEKISLYNASKELFTNSKIILVKAGAVDDVSYIKKIIDNGDALIISTQNPSREKNLKKTFVENKSYIFVDCYELNRDLKSKIINYTLQKENLEIDKEVFWYLLDNLDDKYVFLENKLLHLINLKKEINNLTLIKKIVSPKFDQNAQKVLFNIFSNNQKLLKIYNSSILQISDFYIFFNNIKLFFNIIIESQSENDALSKFPRYLFREKNDFIKIYKNINDHKKSLIIKLFQKTEILVRKNNSQYHSIGMRLLFNLKKTITS